MLEISIFTGGIAQTNGYLIQINDQCMVIDAPDGMANYVAQSGKKPVALLLTHQHFDHCQDAAALVEAFDVPVYAFEKFSRELTLEFLMGFHRGTSFEVREFTVTHELKGQERVEIGGENFELAHIPGHSVDSLTFYLPSEKTVFGGDVLFEGSVGRTDFPNGSMKLLVAGIQKHLFTLPEETVVYPGHGDRTTIGSEKRFNPYLAG